MNTTVFDSSKVLSPFDAFPDEIDADAFARAAMRVRERALREGITRVTNGKRIAYPMLPSLRVVQSEFDCTIRAASLEIYAGWNSLLTAFGADAALRDYLQPPQALLPWILASASEDFRVDFCRFDSVGDSVAGFRFCEFNANCPGGVLYAGRYMQYWEDDEVVGPILESWGVSSEMMSSPAWFVELMLESTELRKGEVVALLRQPHGNDLELDAMSSVLHAAGHPVCITDPSARDWRACNARSGYLKYGVQASMQDLHTWGDFLDRVVSGDFRMPNPLPGRWVGDNKLCMAALSDGRFDYLLSSSQIDAIARYLPVSRKIGDGVDGRTLLREQTRWVIKTPYDTQGRGVFVGSEMELEEWKRVVDAGQEGGWLAQERTEPGSRSWDGKRVYQDLAIPIVRGEVAGFVSRLSENFKVNVAQGGGRQVVFAARR